MQQTLVDQVRERLRPFGGFLVPESAEEAISTKRGGHIYLIETPECLHTRIVRSDGRTITDIRPLDEPSRLAIAVRALTFRARA